MCAEHYSTMYTLCHIVYTCAIALLEPLSLHYVLPIIGASEACDVSSFYLVEL